MIKSIGLISIIIVMVGFGCNDDGNGNENILYFGSLGTAIDGLGSGNYIYELSDSSNIATIGSERSDTDVNVEGDIDKLLEARYHGIEKSVLFLDHLFFKIEPGNIELRTDYEERWAQYSAYIAPYIADVEVIYPLDEPYWNCCYCYQDDMTLKETKDILETVAALVKETFPNIKVGSCFGYPVLDGEIELPRNYDIVGFDFYYAVQPEPRDIEQFFNDYNSYLDILKNQMLPHQKLLIVPGGFHPENRYVSESELKRVADFYYDLARNDLAVNYMIVFLYPSVPGTLVGLEDLPQLKLKYQEIGSEIKNR